MQGDRRGGQRWRWPLVALAGLMTVAGCSSGDDGGAPPVGADGYSTAIHGFLPPAPDDGSRPVVYIARLGDDPFPLEDQVAMIDAVAESHDLRFVDDVDAAVDGEDPDAPPRDDGLLLGVGTISAATPHVVRIEVYATVGSIDAHKLTLTVRNEVWRVDTIEPIDPEVLVGDE